MKFTIFASAIVAAANANEESWFEGEMFGQVSAETLDFNAAFDDAADFFIQIGAQERSGLGQVLVQTKSEGEAFLAELEPESRVMFNNLYAQTREEAFNWLSQIDESSRARMGEMLSQTSAGQYFMQAQQAPVVDQINNFFAQQAWSEEPADDSLAQVDTDAEVQDGELEEMAQFLAQLDDVEMQRLNNLVQIKQNTVVDDEEYDF